MDKELTPKQQTSEAVRQAETILVMTSQHPSIDQVASTIALTKLLRKFGKKCTAVISDDIPAGAKFLDTSLLERQMGGLRDFIMQMDLSHAEVDKLKYTIEGGKLNVHVTPFAGGFRPSDVSFAYGQFQFDLVIILGVPSYGRIDKVYAQNAELLSNIPLANIDYHRSNEHYGAINLIEPTAASLAEILIALSESLQGGLIDDTIATTMLTGLFASTDRFTASHTTAKTMTVAAQMVAMGANQQQVVKGLYRDRTEKRSSAQPAKKEQQPRQARPEAINMTQAQSQSVQATPVQAQPAPSQPVQMQPQPEPTPTPAPNTVVMPAPEVPDVPAQVATNLPTVEQMTQEVAQTPPPIAQVEPTPAPTPVAMPSTEPVFTPPEPDPEPEDDDENDSQSGSSLDELLPPQHIEPEPLINDTSVKSIKQEPPKPVNPTNNPIFAQRLDDFEY